MIDSLIFFPDRDVPAAPPDVEERWITTADGIRLHAWYAGPASPAATLLWSHGNAGNIAGRVDVLRALAARGLGVLDLARAIRAGRAPRASADLAFHVLDVMASVLDAARLGGAVDVGSRVEVPPPLEPGWDPTRSTLS